MDEKVEGAISFRVKSNEYYIPIEGSVNTEHEIAKLKKSHSQFVQSTIVKKFENEQ